MKNLKFSLFTMVLAVVALSFTSCGDESEDPQPKEPTKTNLELVKEGIIGTWELQSIVVTDNSVDYTFNGGCDETGFPQAVKANLEDIDFKFAAGAKASQILNCQSKTVESTYEVKETNGKLLVTTSNGWEFEIITPAKDLSKKTVQVNSGMRLQDVEKVVMTFTLK